MHLLYHCFYCCKLIILKALKFLEMDFLFILITAFWCLFLCCLCSEGHLGATALKNHPVYFVLIQAFLHFTWLL